MKEVRPVGGDAVASISDMPIDTLTIINIMLVIFVSGSIAGYAHAKYDIRPTPRTIFAYIIIAWLLTLASVLIIGKRGGEPARVYGWPKEIVLVRTWTMSAFLAYGGMRWVSIRNAVIDVCFFGSLVVGFDALRTMVRRKIVSKSRL